jgi:hypothetical protein
LKPVPILIPAAWLFGAAAAYFLTGYLFKAFYQSQKRRSPCMQDFLRAPGQSSEERIDYLNGRIGRQAALLITLPLILCSIYLSYLFIYKAQLNPLLVRTVMLAGAGLSIYFLVKILKLIKERRMARLAYEGEITVGRELDRLVAEGNHVYHDFPAEDCNIDHIVIGRSGIFAVETGARSKPAATNRTDDATVEYNGKILMFPNGDDYKTIARAERQASWISEWISRTVGEQVAARAIVALPGWFVKRTSPDGISVVNPKQFPSLFKHIKPRFLTDEMITRIAAQIEQKCRDVKLLS